MKRIVFFAFAAFFAVMFGASTSFADSSQCNVVGISSVKEFVTKRQRKCFANVRKAQRAGFDAFQKRSFTFSLTGAEEVPPVTTTATGDCGAVINKDTKKLYVSCDHTIVSAVAAHVHQAPIGQDGPIICPATSAASPLAITCTLTDVQLAAALAGNLYVNVHSVANQDGEIRGQIK